MSSHKSVLFSRPVAEASSLGNNPCRSIQSVNHGLLLHEIYQGNAPPPPFETLFPFQIPNVQDSNIFTFLLDETYLMSVQPAPKMFMPYPTF